MSVDTDITQEVHTRDSLLYAQTIHHGLQPRERRALAAVLGGMPCSVAAVARAAGISRRTAQRACAVLESDLAGLIQRTADGLAIHPDAIGGVESWADRYGHRSGSNSWWEDPKPTHHPDGQHDYDAEGWPNDGFPEPAPGEVAMSERIEFAKRAVESRRVHRGRGTFIPFAVLGYVTATRSLQAAKVAVECGRRVSSSGIAEFARGELSEVTEMSSQQVTNALSRMTREGIASSATTTRVQLDLNHGQGWVGVDTREKQKYQLEFASAQDGTPDLRI